MAPRVIGIDPGTKSFDVFGLENEEVFLDESIPTEEVDRDPDKLIQLLLNSEPLDAVAGPSGYGLPLKHISQLSSEDLFQIFLVRPDDVELSILTGFSRLVEGLRKTNLNVYFIPDVIHLPTVPEHRKLNMIDMGTADKLCCAVLAVHDYSKRHGIPYDEVSAILVEVGFAFNAVIAIERGRIVDGIGGTKASLGFLTCGALDGEVAYLLGSFSKNLLFTGGVRTIVGDGMLKPEDFPKIAERTVSGKIAWEAFIEGVEKNVRAIQASVKKPEAIIISGRLSSIPEIYKELEERLSEIAAVEKLEGFQARSKAAA